MKRTMRILTILAIGLLVTGCASSRISGGQNRSEDEAVGGSRNPGKPQQTPGTGDLPAATAHSGAVQRGARSDLTGVWQLNRALSDDPAKKLEEARKMLREGRGRRAGLFAMGGRGDDARDDPWAPRELEALMAMPRTLELSYHEPELVLTDNSGRRRIVYTDNRGASVTASGGMSQQTTIAGWEGGALVIETTSGGGELRRVEHYRLAGDGQRLTITTELLLANREKPLTVTCVYDRTYSPAGGQ